MTRARPARWLARAGLGLGLAAAVASCGGRSGQPAANSRPAGPPAKPASAPAGAAAPLAPDAARLRAGLRAGRLLVIGLDGADWRFLDPELAAGRLPHFARLVEHGARGDLVALEPLLSPLLWTSLATGVPPERHGVLDFFEKDAGGDLRVVTAASRRVPALWDILSAVGEPVGLVGWWASHPAPHLRGVAVSDRVTLTVFPGARVADLEQAVWPPEWRARVARLRLDPSAVSLDLVRRVADVDAADLRTALSPSAPATDPLHMLVDTLAATATGARLADAVWQSSPRALFVYFDGTDIVGHLFAPAAPPALPGVSPDLVRRFGDTPRRYWQWLDGQLAPLLDAVTPADTVVLVSDHGFRWGSDRPAGLDSGTTTRTAVLWHQPAGLVLVAGAGARAGARGSGGTLDFLPTLLALLGLPPGRDMPGAPLQWALDFTPRAQSPVDYGAWQSAERAAPAVASAADREALARLRALGYLGSESAQARSRDEPLTTGALNNLGARLLADGDLAGAAGAFERAIRSDPDYPGAYQNLASIQMRQGRTRDAVRTFLAGLAHEPARADEATVEMALALRERGEPALAIELLSRARAIRPPSYTLTLNLGTLLGEQGRFAEALTCFRQACDLEPASAVAWRNVAVAAARLGALDEARRAARRSLELDAAQPELRELAGR